MLVRRALFLIPLALGGCGIFTKSESQRVPEVKTKEAPGRPQITVGELDQMTKNYADRLVSRVATACDVIKKESPEEEKRAKAHQHKLEIALAAYDIVTSPGAALQFPAAAQHLLDLLVLTELEALRWVDEGAAKREFGDVGEKHLVQAFSKARDDARSLGLRVMSQDQIDQLLTLVRRWRTENPEIEWLAKVRFDVIGQADTTNLKKNVGETFNVVEGAIQQVEGIRIAAEQAVFYFKRLPTILNWTTEATLSDALAVPDVSALVHGLGGTLETLKHLLEPSSQDPAINSTIREAREALERGEGLVKEIRELEPALRPYMLKPKEESPTPGKKMDVEAVVSKLDDTAKNAASLVRETRGLAESPGAMRNVDDVLTRATDAMSRQGHELIRYATWRAILLVLIIAALFGAYKGIAWALKRRSTAAR